MQNIIILKLFSNKMFKITFELVIFFTFLEIISHLGDINGEYLSKQNTIYLKKIFFYIFHYIFE